MATVETTNVWSGLNVAPFQNGASGLNYLCVRGQGAVNGVRHSQWNFRFYGTVAGSAADIPSVIPVAIHFTANASATLPSNPAIGTGVAQTLMTWVGTSTDLMRQPQANMSVGVTYCKHVIAVVVPTARLLVEPDPQQSPNVSSAFETSVEVFLAPGEMPWPASGPRQSVQATVVAGNFTNLLTLTTLQCDVTVTTLTDT